MPRVVILLLQYTFDRKQLYERNDSISWLLMPWRLASPGHQQAYVIDRRGQTGTCLPRWRISTTYGVSVSRNDIKCKYISISPHNIYSTLQWRHNGRDNVSKQQSYDCLRNRLFRRRSKKTSKLRVTVLYSPGAGKFPAQMASYAENVSICWRHHDPKVEHMSI